VKKLVTIFLALLVSGNIAFTQKTVNKFIDKIKKHDAAVAMTLPGWFIRTGINLSTQGIEDRDEHEIVNLGKKIKKLRFVVVDRAHHISLEESTEFLTRVKEKEGFEEYTKVRDGDTRIYVLVKEHKEKIKYLTIYARGENNVALLNLKTDLTFSELKQTNFSWKDKEKLKEEIN
jgi:hypothetical protein